MGQNWELRDKSRESCPSSHVSLLQQQVEKLMPQIAVQQAQAGLLVHGEGGLLMTNRRLVGPLCAQRIVNIHDLQNPWQERDLASAQSVRITRSVDVLMMVTDDGKHQAQRLQRLADIFSGRRMLLHDLPLFGR